MRTVLAMITALAITVLPAEAGTRIGVGGVTTTVAPGAAGPLQCVLDALQTRGYPVRFIRGHGRGSVRGSLHPSGHALDVNQTARGRTTPPMPSDEVALARACGAISGASWRNNDSGHFQVGGWDGSRTVPRVARHQKKPDKVIELNFVASGTFEKLAPRATEFSASGQRRRR